MLHLLTLLVLLVLLMLHLLALLVLLMLHLLALLVSLALHVAGPALLVLHVGICMLLPLHIAMLYVANSVSVAHVAGSVLCMCVTCCRPSDQRFEHHGELARLQCERMYVCVCVLHNVHVCTEVVCGVNVCRLSFGLSMCPSSLSE